MGIKIPEEIKEYAGLFGRGIIIKAAPEVVKGILVGIMKTKKTNVQGVTKWVEENVSLWDALEPKHQEGLMRLGEYVKNLDWLTASYFIDAIREELPAVASLFLGWKKANNWLERQIETIKTEIQK